MILCRIQPLLVGLVALGLLGSAASASAQRRGTHFFVELQAGSFARQELGPGGSILFGAGGTVPYSLLRMYLLAEAGASRTEHGDLYRQRDERSFGQLGVRFLLPVADPVRFFADVLGGFSVTHTELYRDWGARLIDERTGPQATIAAGLQVRFLYALSVGFRGQVQFTEDPFADFHERLGRETPGPIWGLTGSLTWHF